MTGLIKRLNLDNTQRDTCDYSLYDARGHLLDKGVFPGNNFYINGKMAGVHILKIEYTGGYFQKRFIIY